MMALSFDSIHVQSVTFCYNIAKGVIRNICRYKRLRKYPDTLLLLPMKVFVTTNRFTFSKSHTTLCGWIAGTQDTGKKGFEWNGPLWTICSCHGWMLYMQRPLALTYNISSYYAGARDTWTFLESLWIRFAWVPYKISIVWSCSSNEVQVFPQVKIMRSFRL